MSSNITITKVTDRPVAAAACSLDVSLVSLRGAGLSLASALLPVLPVRERSERPTGAPAVAAAKAQATAYAFTSAAAGAGAKGATTAEGGAHGINGAKASGLGIGQQQKKTQHGMWAYRGPEPWSDPT
ncbi:hypothetical protein SAMN05216223_102224 [Actinacidiphila yanglinensis]|uniref:Uncharacterized protein n=1 Tax=Actinacidiphila yanglinensis TaxID=310779 RepID=A0A1H5VB20_9ACTN|nr:hypothetical protein [Actinacidiphila yanglinensis]SEF84414.1 hypothetical protein SAMN05216223_102224 [Actinacidiphila yanglinensis]